MKAIQCHGTLLNPAIYHETLATCDRYHILMKHRSAFHTAPINAYLLHNKSFTSLKANPRELKNLAHNSDHNKTHLKCILPILQKPETTLSPNEKKNTHSNSSIPPQTFHNKSSSHHPEILFFYKIKHKSNPTPKFLLPSHPILHIHTYMNTYIPSSKPVETCIHTYVRTKPEQGAMGGKIPSSHHHHHHHQGTRMDLHATKKVPSPYIFVRA